MRNNRKILVGLVAAAALAAAGTSVYADPQGYGPGYGPGACAQGGPGAGYGPGAGRGGFGPGMMGGRGAGRGGYGMWSNPAAAIEGYLASLKVELKIAPDQDRAWQSFSATARKQAESMSARREQMFSQASADKQTAPERLAQRTEFAKQGVASMEAMTAAVKDLYAVLTPEQKVLADQQLARGPMGGPGGFHRFGRGQ